MIDNAWQLGSWWWGASGDPQQPWLINWCWVAGLAAKRTARLHKTAALPNVGKTRKILVHLEILKSLMVNYRFSIAMRYTKANTSTINKHEFQSRQVQHVPYLLRPDQALLFPPYNDCKINALRRGLENHGTNKPGKSGPIAPLPVSIAWRGKQAFNKTKPPYFHNAHCQDLCWMCAIVVWWSWCIEKK